MQNVYDGQQPEEIVLLPNALEKHVELFYSDLSYKYFE